MKAVKIMILAAAGLSVWSMANLVRAAVPVPMGWYMEGNVGSSISQNPNYGAGAPSRSGFAWNVNFGYKFMPYFGAEVGYTSYADVKINNPSSSTQAAKDQHFAGDIAGKAMLPVGDTGAEIFGKIGVSRIYSKVSITNDDAATGLAIPTGNHAATGLYYGVGADYSFMPNLSVNVQWAKAKGSSSTGDQNLYTAGVNYNFG